MMYNSNCDLDIDIEEQNPAYWNWPYEKSLSYIIFIEHPCNIIRLLIEYLMMNDSLFG